MLLQGAVSQHTDDKQQTFIENPTEEYIWYGRKLKLDVAVRHFFVNSRKLCM